MNKKPNKQANKIFSEPMKNSLLVNPTLDGSAPSSLTYC